MSAKKRKAKVNYSGLTAQEERRFKKQFTFGQTQIAEYLGVDRRTVARWCLQGLPYKRGAPGHEHKIELKTALHWSIGRDRSTKLNVELSSLETILLGLAIGYCEGLENQSLSKWRSQMLQETAWLNATQQKIAFGIGRMVGLRLLPFKRQQW